MLPPNFKAFYLLSITFTNTSLTGALPLTADAILGVKSAKLADCPMRTDVHTLPSIVLGFSLYLCRLFHENLLYGHLHGQHLNACNRELLRNYCCLQMQLAIWDCPGLQRLLQGRARQWLAA